MDLINDNLENNEEYRHPDKLSEMTGYDHLHNMCKEVRNVSHSGNGYLNPITPRLQYIMYALACQGISFEFIPLENKNGSLTSDSNKLANVMVTFVGSDESLPTIFFTAHHDIANPNSENCQDNSASVCNLIHLCSILQNDKPLNTTVIGFTDCEEIGGRGINKLITDITDGKYGAFGSLFALELTANGRNIWSSGTIRNSSLVDSLIYGFEKEIHIVRTPYNESINVRASGLEACCIGSLSDSEIEVAVNRGFCDTWGLCHKLGDTFENSANKEDMINFVLGLKTLVN